MHSTLKNFGMVSIIAAGWFTTASAMETPSDISANVPTDVELEARGARIGYVDVQVDDVFETSQHLAAPYRLVNALHINSHSSTILAELLFRSGDVFERRVLDESERILRSQRYLNAAIIQVIAYHPEDNTVDLRVRVHDVWTLSPGFSYGRKGGVNSTSADIEENNLFGFGKRIELGYSQNVDRNSTHIRYYDPNILGSWWTLTTAYATSSDGGEKTIDVSRPFYSLDTRWSVGVLGSDISSAVSKYSHGDLLEEFTMHRRLLDIGGGWSGGLRDGWVRRYLAGIRYDDREFLPFQDQAATIPADRTVSYPWVGFELIRDNYLKTRNLDLIGRTEDFHLGPAARIDIGYATSALSSTHSGLVVRGSSSLGTAFGERQYWFNSFVWEGRWESSMLRNGIAEFENRYYLRETPHLVFFASLGATLTEHLDPESQLTLGGDSGLRGYPLRYQAGAGRGLFTLEQRFYTNWQPLKLFTVGGAVFFDAGKTWGHDDFGGEQFSILKDVGVGLRLGNARSALGNVLHIDLAFPLDASSTISKMQIIVETKRSF